MSSTLYPRHNRHRKRWYWAASATAVLLLAATPSSRSLAQNFVDNRGSLDDAIGNIESTVLNLLGLARWQAQLNDLLSDPCRDIPVVFITTPEPG